MAPKDDRYIPMDGGPGNAFSDPDKYDVLLTISKMGQYSNRRKFSAKETRIRDIRDIIIKYLKL